MKNTVFIICTGLFFLISFQNKAQEKELTIEDAVTGQISYLYPDYILKLLWKGKSDNYTYVKDNVLVMGNVKTDKTEEILKPEEMTAAFKDMGFEAFSTIPVIEWLDENTFRFFQGTDLGVFNMKTKKAVYAIKCSQNAENFDFTNNMLAYTVENNLYLADKAGKVTRVTTDENKGIVNGQVVHRNEFGITKGTFWSPGGKFLAFYRMDESMVTEYPLVDITKRIAEEKKIRYPMAGMKSHEVTVGIFEVATGKTTFLKTGDPKEQYLTNIAWDPDEKSLYIAVLNREQNHMKLNRYDIASGEMTKTLFEEQNEKYVEPLHPVIFLKSRPNQFLWQSQRDGYNHFYLYDTEGKLIRQVTKGDWMVLDFHGFDEKEEYVYYSSTAVSPLEKHTYRTSINTGLTFKITLDEGYHNSKVSGSGKYILDSYSSVKVPKAVDLLSCENKKIYNLLTSRNPLKDYKLSEAKIITMKAADEKTDLYGQLIRPLNFDPAKKYPAIIYVYGGPHAQMVTNSWLGGVNLWEYYMAQKGYVVLVLDNRGSSGRGFAFESVIHRNIGVAESADQMKGVDYLRGLGYVDMDRIGVHGWSYGGFMTTLLMTSRHDVFKVGVAGGPVTDWKYYEIMYGERYMDTPDENPDGYRNASLMNRVDSLKGKLMIIHGYLDNTVVLQHSLSFIEECIKKGRQVDYFLYPTHEHNVSYGPDRVHLMEKVTRYFDDYLK